MTARRVLGVFLLAMALAQLSAPRGFADVIDRFRVPRVSAGVLAGAVIAVELLGASVAGRGRPGRVGAWLAAVIALGWTALGTQAFVRGLSLDNCGCFSIHLAQRLRWWTLTEDAVFVASASLALHTSRHESLTQPRISRPPQTELTDFTTG